ncbi:MAG: polyphosphate kinase 1 [Bacteroidota bacterium]|jgi:polyphosphate kinase|nr:polyphosphate kinase 1 [Bacteroidota bacterium]
MTPSEIKATTNIHHLHARAQDVASEDRTQEYAQDVDAGAPAVDLYAPDVYFNRELSWLDFNWRVLNEALDPAVPLLERLKFLCITSSNLDEFFMIRVAGLKQQIELAVTDLPPDGMTAEETLAAVRDEVCRMNAAMSECFLREIVPGLEPHGVVLHSYDELDETSRDWCERYFIDHVFPVLSPLAIDPGHPFPHLLNRSLNLVIIVVDSITQEERIAVVQVPPVVPRLVHIPVRKDGYHYVLLGEVIAANADALFPGLQVRESYRFRITRNADLDIAEDEAADLLKTIEEQIRRRRWGAVVRVEMDHHMPRKVYRMLQKAMHLDEQDVYAIEGPLNLADFMDLVKLPLRHLKDAPFTPRIIEELRGDHNIFDRVRERDLFFHHPYDSFSSVVEFIEVAADDPDVLAIKQTLYRTGGDSSIVRALARAAANGKQVTAFVELKARFDEENNIIWARRLEQAGVHVVYGIIGLKTHCKLAVVVRREKHGLRTYVHMSSGNYNEITARLYTDFGLMTCRDDMAFEGSALFNYLTGYSHQTEWEKIIIAPVSLRKKILSLIQREMENKKAGKSARIVGKLNALVDAQVIRALYRASQAGVDIDLVVRGICCLRPGVPGLSEHIRITSIVGRFLEHSRVFMFGNDGDPEFYFSSADWMPRNLNRRVEAMFLVEEQSIKDRLMHHVIPTILSDTAKSYTLHADGKYRRTDLPPEAPRLDSQEMFIRYAELAYRERHDDEDE